MRKVLYGFHNIRDLHINACHLGLCDYRQRKHCEKEGKCLKQLSGSNKRHIAKVFHPVRYDDEKQWQKIDIAVDKWRNDVYKRCRPVEFFIRRFRK